MQSAEAKEEEEKMDYDELTLNPLLAEMEFEASGDADSKGGKPRRYWTPKEEERFFEIWGRDNWRLTRHGKNTIFFAQWSAELKERFDIDVKAEEIQAKVNQTRAKFRQVKKQLEADKNSTRWKKYDIIAKILKNQYRPKDAEPVPLEALESNRDFSSDELTRQPSPTSITTSNSNTQDATHSVSEHGNAQAQAAVAGVDASEQDVKPEIDLHEEHNVSASLYNNSNSTHYNTELFSDEVKQEFEEEVKTPSSEYQNSYNNYPYHEQNHYGGTHEASHAAPPQSEGEPQLHQLQTPQQLQQQQQQMQQYQQYRPETSAAAPSVDTTVAGGNAATHFPPHMPPLPAHTGYDASNAYANHSHYSTASPAAGTPPVYNHQYGNSNYAAHNSASMQPPTRTVHSQPRRRRTSSVSVNNMNNMTVSAAGGLSADSLECMYLEEVRKKNTILAEQKDISNKLLLLEERKVALLEQFFPKCLELQQEILQKLNNT